MASPRLLHPLSWVPLVLMGLVAVVAGFLGLVAKVSPVPGTEIHRFSGLWLMALGGVICAYVFITLMGTRRARNTLLVILGIVMAFLLYLEITFIPQSPFLILTYVLLVPYLISLWASVRLNREENQD
ncbi:MAG: hypothetical protein ACE5LH_00855 [Fidelibacterota bacterium]